MIAWRGILLLETCLVFLINDDQPRIFERQEDCTPRPENNIVRFIGELFRPNFHTLGITISAMVDAQPTAKNSLQAFHDLYGESYFGEQIKHLLVFVESFLYQMDVYLSLA